THPVPGGQVGAVAPAAHFTQTIQVATRRCAPRWFARIGRDTSPGCPLLRVGPPGSPIADLSSGSPAVRPNRELPALIPHWGTASSRLQPVPPRSTRATRRTPALRSRLHEHTAARGAGGCQGQKPP